MSPNKLVKVIQNFYHKLQKQPQSHKNQSLWLLRAFMVTKKRPEWVNAGFVLPTVAMVSLVVVLLTTAILFRSFERSKNASNVRVNEAVLNAAAPALDRAKAKIDKLFADPRLPRSTPNDTSLDLVITGNLDEFTFGDESQLKLAHGGEELTTAWRYRVDTDNDGKFDSYTLYGIYFKNPNQTGGNPDSARTPLQARTPPMNETQGNPQCDRGNDTSAQLIGSQGWYQRGSTLRRSVFVYTATVPITDLTNLDGNKFEVFQGNKGFVALEYQQDRERRPLTNNAVFYNDDLEISPGGGVRLNGRVVTNSNLFTGQRFENPVEFYLVSSPDSCYYNEQNSKVVVGGNVVNARINDTGNINSGSNSGTRVHLFRESGPSGTPARINKDNKTVNLNGGKDIAYNSLAYEQRINLLVQAAKLKSTLPTEVIESDRDIDKALRTYFLKRTRRVPFREVPIDNPPDKVFRKLGGGEYTVNNVLGTTDGDSMRPPNEWVFPFDPDDGISHGDYANLQLSTNGNNKIDLAAKATEYPEPEGEETYIGDRVVVGNNLPELWWDDTKNKFVRQEEAGQEIENKVWDEGSGTRKRFPQIRQLDDLGATDRDEFWEKSAAEYPEDRLDVVGGLRVVTGAGIYLPDGYTTTDTRFTTALAATDEVWSDQMPMGVTSQGQGLPSSETPYLQMRATAVYHFQSSAYDPDTPSTNPQTPIACVSSFYDPTNEDTAQNISTLPWRNPDANLTATNGRSNNGIAYPAPTGTKSTYLNALEYQADLKYPNGRLVNKQLKKALDKGSGNLTLSEKSALDSAICALQILDGTLTPSNAVIPHGAIRETAFLDARQVKAIDKPGRATNYDLDVELRQPLEIRATVLDMEELRTTSVGTTTNGTTEYLLPNSGIIYATRDDALPDISADTTPGDDNDEVNISATDYQLDPTRRPNAIMLINGAQLNRTNDDDHPEEKGLILVSNLPVYIKDNFNLHTQEEFNTILTSNWSNFYTRTEDDLNTNFACRPGQFNGCTTGETWRPATVIADAITVLSGTFREGFRNEGDYDLRNNSDIPGTVDARRNNGFWDNSFVTSFPWQDNVGAEGTSGFGFPASLEATPTLIRSSYFNNFVTPIQRRALFAEYVMEICRKPTVTACQPSDWVVGYDDDEDGSIDWDDSAENDKNAVDSGSSRIMPNDADYTVDRLGAGTTARPALNPEDQRYPRRVAFLRDDTTHELILDDNNQPIPLGINNDEQVNYYPFNDKTIASVTYSKYASGNRPRLHPNALWFRTRNGDDDNYGYNYPLWIKNRNTTTDPNILNSTSQPLLIPVLQIHFPFKNTNDNKDDRLLSERISENVESTASSWLQNATPTETNLVFVQGDTPSRPNESNGGLGNFVRYLERWKDVQHKASGSFIQYKRSSFATAPWLPIVADYDSRSDGFSPDGTIFGYPQMYRTTVNVQSNTTLGRTPFYVQPDRSWGFDVALLTQLPDLFSQRFTAPPTGEPNEFYREVSRDDPWMSTLLCAKEKADDTEYAIDANQRPSQCQD